MISQRMVLVLCLAAGVLCITGTVVRSLFSAAISKQRARVSHGSQVVPSPFGQIEYALAGQGAPVLVVHGAGGGFDQAIAIAGKLIEGGHQIIAPSRFDYLRSASPSDPSPENQAEAFAFLLDNLQIQKAAIVGISAGVLSSLQFAARHPDRCRSLTLIVPAATAAGQTIPDQGPLPALGPVSKAIIEFTLRSDLLFWSGINIARDWMIRSVLATDPAIVAAASPDERQRVHDVLWNILPLSERAQGILNDTRLTSTPMSIALEQIRAPTLVISLEDDLYGTIVPARHIAAKVPGARLMTFASGGHAMVGHAGEVFAEVDAFLKKH